VGLSLKKAGLNFKNITGSHETSPPSNVVLREYIVPVSLEVFAGEKFLITLAAVELLVE
jgi:hypothetical protein